MQRKLLDFPFHWLTKAQFWWVAINWIKCHKVNTAQAHQTRMPTACSIQQNLRIKSIHAVHTGSIYMLTIVFFTFKNNWILQPKTYIILSSLVILHIWILTSLPGCQSELSLISPHYEKKVSNDQKRWSNPPSNRTKNNHHVCLFSVSEKTSST